jgi:uncharacterized RDD family membrane protein YckC
MKTLHRIPDNVQYAGFAKRLKAFAFDYLIILAYILVMAGVNFGITLRGRMIEEISPYFASPVIKDVVAFLTLILPVILYFALQESSPRQGTWGKRKAGIRVITAQGESLTKIQALVRSLVKFLPWQIAHTSIYQIREVVPEGRAAPFDITGFVLVYILIGIYLAAMFISKKRRTPYDWISGSYVVVDK